MGSYNLNYTSSQINSLLQKGNGLVTPDVSSLILKTTASATYITQTNMSNTYQYGTNYALASDLNSKVSSSTWSSNVSIWASWSSSAITRARNTIYPVNSIYINWAGTSTPSFGSWTEITTSGIIGQWRSNYDSVNETFESDSSVFSGGAYNFSCRVSSETVTHNHIGYDYNGSGNVNHERVFSINTSSGVSNKAGGGAAGSATTRFVRTNANTSNTYSYGNFASATCEHAHSVSSAVTHGGYIRTISAKQVTDAIHIFTRTA